MEPARFLGMMLCPLVLGVTPLQAQEELKVFISVDMEGITGVISREETGPSGADYEYYRSLMTKETNAAIEGAVEAGATEIIVRDAHGSARNLLPEELNRKAKLLREWSGSPLGMMEGIDGTFDAVLFVGYHAKAGTRNATMDHTMSGTIYDLQVNGVSLPEAGWNGLIAGCYDVPVVFIAGDEAVCKQARALFGNTETVAVKEGMGEACLNLHPEVSRELIKAGVKQALGRLTEFSPLKYEPPYTIEVQFKNEHQASRGSWYPGAKRHGDWGVSYTSHEFLDLMRFLMLAGR